MSELRTDYWACFQTFVAVNSIPDDKKAEVFLKNHPLVLFKMLSNLAFQLFSPKYVNVEEARLEVTASIFHSALFSKHFK